MICHPTFNLVELLVSMYAHLSFTVSSSSIITIISTFVFLSNSKVLSLQQFATLGRSINAWWFTLSSQTFPDSVEYITITNWFTDLQRFKNLAPYRIKWRWQMRTSDCKAHLCSGSSLCFDTCIFISAKPILRRTQFSQTVLQILQHKIFPNIIVCPAEKPATGSQAVEVKVMCCT